MTNKKAANLVKNEFGAKNMKKEAMSVESAPDKTEIPISSTIMMTRSLRVSASASKYASHTASVCLNLSGKITDRMRYTTRHVTLTVNRIIN